MHKDPKSGSDRESKKAFHKSIWGLPEPESTSPPTQNYEYLLLRVGVHHLSKMELTRMRTLSPRGAPSSHPSSLKVPEALVQWVGVLRLGNRKWLC